jgi:hypothetical protein
MCAVMLPPGVNPVEVKYIIYDIYISDHKFQLQSVKLVPLVFVSVADLMCKPRGQNVWQSRKFNCGHENLGSSGKVQTFITR